MKRRVYYSPRIVIRICRRIADGESVNRICAEDGMPGRWAFYKWLDQQPKLLAMYELALEMRADVHADEITDIADEAPIEMVTIIGEKEIRRLDYAGVAHRRLRVDTRKWIAARLRPKKYGDRMALTDGEGKPLATAPPVINIGFGNGGPGSDPNSEPDPSAEGS